MTVTIDDHQVHALQARFRELDALACRAEAIRPRSRRADSTGGVPRAGRMSTRSAASMQQWHRRRRT